MFAQLIFFNVLNESTRNELSEISEVFNDIVHEMIDKTLLNDVYLKNGLINYINSLFTICLISGCSILLTCIIVSKIISFNYSDDLDNTHNEYIDAMSKEYDEDYVFKYDEIFGKSQELYHTDTLSNIEKTELKNKFIREKTPKGEVIMSYNFEKDIWLSSFKYYCNDSSIPYSYLETVAKLYVSEYKCPYFFLTIKKIKQENDMKELINTNNNSNNTINNNTNDKNKVEEVKSVFASFKSYNSVKKTNNNISNKSQTNNKSSNDDIVLLKNRFTRLGNIEDYDDIIKKELNSLKKTIPIDFSEFKRMGINK
jgi:hypothetical protein